MVELLNRAKMISLEIGVKANHAKTKLMVVDRSDSLKLTGALNFETEEDIIYLGANINNTGSCLKEIRRRIEMGRSVMAQLQGV